MRHDVALLYRAEAAMDLAHVFRITGLLGERPHPSRRGEVEWWCEADLVYNLREPLHLWDLREEPRLRAWQALEMNFHGSAFPIDGTTWAALLAMASPRDRIELRKYGGS